MDTHCKHLNDRLFAHLDLFDLSDQFDLNLESDPRSLLPLILFLFSKNQRGYYFQFEFEMDSDFETEPLFYE